MEYGSTVECLSKISAGVTFHIRRMSFGRRLELLTILRDLAMRHELHDAAKNTLGQISAAIDDAEVQRAYLVWGLDRIEGLTIDGQPAESANLLDAGPEGLCREIAQRVRDECFLTETERKN